MEYIIIKVAEVYSKYILGETPAGIGYKFLTLSEDSYEPGAKLKIFIYEEIKVDKSNSISINRFAFLNKCTKELFVFLIQTKGIGAKGAISIMENFYGSKNLFNALKNNETLKIINSCKKYASQLISSIPNFKKKHFQFSTDFENNKKNIKSELYNILVEMKYKPEKCISAINCIEQKFTKQGQEIKDFPIENTLKEVLNYLSND